jgi:hypothetical protein
MVEKIGAGPPGWRQTDGLDAGGRFWTIMDARKIDETGTICKMVLVIVSLSPYISHL